MRAKILDKVGLGGELLHDLRSKHALRGWSRTYHGVYEQGGTWLFLLVYHLVVLRTFKVVITRRSLGKSSRFNSGASCSETGERTPEINSKSQGYLNKIYQRYA